GNRAGRSRDAAHAPVRALERLHADALDDLHAELARPPREAGGDFGRAGEPVSRPPHRGDQIVDAQSRHELLSVGGSDDSHVAAEPTVSRSTTTTPARPRRARL